MLRALTPACVGIVVVLLWLSGGGRAGSGPGDRADRSRAGPGVRTDHRRDAPRSGPRGLADGVPHLRLPGLQSPRPDHTRERRPAPARLDARDGRGSGADPAAGLRRRDVRRPARLRPSAGHRRHHRRPDLGLPAGAAGRHPPVRSVRQPHAAPRPVRRAPLPPDRRRAHRRHRRAHRRARLGIPHGGLPAGDQPLVRRRDRQWQRGQRTHLQPLEPGGALLRGGSRRGRRGRALAHLHRGRGRRSRRRDLGHAAHRAPRPRLSVGRPRQLRPRAEPHLLGRRGAAAVSPADPARDLGRGRPLAVRAVLQLDHRDERRHRRHRLVLSVPAVRRLGSGLRAGAHPHRHGGQSRPGGGALDQPEAHRHGGGAEGRGRAGRARRPCSSTTARPGSSSGPTRSRSTAPSGS